MLVTTCPECQTTFRVTEAILAKASGQVRCGRCAHIFDAKAALREHDDAETRPVTALAATPRETPPEAKPIESSGIMRSWILQDAPAADSGAAVPATETATEPATEPGRQARQEADSAENDVAEADVAEADVAEAGRDTATAAAGLIDPETPQSALSEPQAHAAARANPPPSEATAAGATEPEAVEADSETSDSYWLPALGEEAAPRRAWPWVTGSAVLAVLLALQLAHHFRGDLVDVPGVGAVIRSTYAALGIPTTGRVDLDQYTTIDLTAVAEPVEGEQGWLVIETRIRNRGPREQPYPYIFVSLLDRWEDKIAGRYFAPDEYVVRPASDYSRMRIGSAVDAQFIIADPGPSATGFELEFCTPAGASFLCENDASLK